MYIQIKSYTIKTILLMLASALLYYVLVFLGVSLGNPFLYAALCFSFLAISNTFLFESILITNTQYLPIKMLSISAIYLLISAFISPYLVCTIIAMSIMIHYSMIEGFGEKKEAPRPKVVFRKVTNIFADISKLRDDIETMEKPLGVSISFFEHFAAIEKSYRNGSVDSEMYKNLLGDFASDMEDMVSIIPDKHADDLEIYQRLLSMSLNAIKQL